jgi:hypothetical protein
MHIKTRGRDKVDSWYLNSSINKAKYIVKQREDELLSTNWLNRLFAYNDTDIILAYNRIENFIYQPKIPFSVSINVDAVIYTQYLKIKEILNISLLNRYGRKVAKLGIIERAKDYGFNSNCYKGSCEYLSNLMSYTTYLRTKRKDYIPKAIDAETTLLNIVNLPADTIFDMFLDESTIIQIFALMKVRKLSLTITKKHYFILLNKVVCKYYNHKGLVQFLLQCGADPNVFNCKYEDPLYLAIDDANFEVVKSLVQYGANIKFRTIKSNHETALAHILYRYLN